jgi:hypothetical protein
MHFNFPFTIVQVLWTLTLAAHLVLLIVLLGRDRTKTFFWFSFSIGLVTLRLIASRLLYGRLPQLTLGIIFVVLADITSIVSVLVLLELARRAFHKVNRKARLAWTFILLAMGATVLATWGHWPAWKTLTPLNEMTSLGLLQLFAQKGGLLTDVLTVSLGLLVILFGRRYGAGARSHTQQIMIGLSTASLSQLAVQIIWQIIAATAKPHSRDEYERIIGLREKLFNANSAVYLAVAIWWIVCLWNNQPGSDAELAEVAVPVGSGDPTKRMSASVEPPGEED